MQITFGTMFNQVAGLFVLLLIGYLMNRYRVLPKEAEDVLARISTKLFLPALQMYTSMTRFTVENFSEYGSLILQGALFTGAVIAIVLLLTKLIKCKDEYLAGVYRYCMSFPNTAGIGTPIILALLGYDGLFQYQLYGLVLNMLSFIWGIPQLMPKEQQGGFRKRLRNVFNTATVSMLFGAFLGLIGVGERMPAAVNTTLEQLGGCYAVVGMLLTGFVIGNYNIKELITDKMSYVIVTFRLVLLPGVFLLLAHFLNLSENLRVLTCLTYGCPCGMGAVIYPAAYGQDSISGARLVLTSSALVVLTLPLLCAMM